MSTNNNLEEDAREPDPVTKNAVAAAMAATDRPPRSWWAKAGSWFTAIILCIATAGAVTGAINSAIIIHAQNELKRQQTCLTTLIAQVQGDGVARTKISADDRKVIRDLVTNITNAKSPADVRKAFDRFNKDNKTNDKNRSNILFKIPEVGDACKVKKVQASARESFTSPSVATSSKSSSVPKAPGSSKSQPSSTVGSPNSPQLTQQPSISVPTTTEVVTKSGRATVTVVTPKPGAETTITKTATPTNGFLPTLPLIPTLTQALCDHLKVCL